jgi:Rrf2 family transcriptional regulator, cysteine metabolism repressor
MRFSARGEYGLLALLELSLHEGNSPVQARTIARSQKIPLRFLEQVLSALRKAGLVESIRGAQGGYLLARPAGEVTLAEVLQAIDGPVVSGGCVSSEGETCWHEAEHGYCVVRETRESVRTSIQQTLNALTLQDIRERHRKRDQNRMLMYHI